MNDLIRREDAIGACAYETFECYEARNAIRNLPSADRPQGEWIFVESKISDRKLKKCSVCGLGYVSLKPDNYCPNCGAKMMNDKGGK